MNYSNSLAGAILIYSNSFSGSGSVNITNTIPDYSAGILGGSNSAAWLDVGGAGDSGGLFANGTVTTVNQGDTWLLPFKPQPGYVYTLSVSVNISANPGNWITAGYAQNYAHYAIGSAPPNGSINSYAWTLRNYTGNTEFFAGAAGGNNVYNSVPAVPTGNGTYTYKQILDTTGSKWAITAFFNNVPLGLPYTYASNPSINALGVGQHSLATPSGYQWTSLTLSAAPIVIGQQPGSANVDAGSAFTNIVVAAAASPSYQWYTNNVPIAGATNASLILNPVTVANAGTNYYVVITNLYGAITSSVASLTVYTNPFITAAYPVSYTTPVTLFGGTNDNGTIYAGSSPTFSVSALGALPIAFQWLTNGVPVGGATSASFTFTNCQLDSPASFACVASNSYGMVTNPWSVSYVPAPTAAFPQAALASQPIAFWRLNESPDDGNGNIGAICHDYQGGNNGGYTNVYLADPGYTNTDPAVAAVNVGSYPSPSGAFGIQGINFAAPSNSSAAFSVEAWVKGASAQTANNTVIALGYGGAEQFFMDVNGGKYRFSVRDASGVLHSASATIGPDGVTWHDVVGVCSEASSNILIYVDGLLSGSATIPKVGGVFASTWPLSIGARSSTATANYDWDFQGDISDAAVWNYALPAAQVAKLYGNLIPVTFVVPLPPTNVVYLGNQTLTIPATVFGQAPLGYYWTNLTTGGVLGSGSTNATGNLNATLTIPIASTNFSGDQLELIVTNANSSTNWFVSLFSPAPPVTLDYSNPILYSNYFNGGTWTLAGTPLTAANALVGGTNATWVDALGVNDTGSLQGNGIDASTLGDSWLLPFTPHSGYVYTVTASVTFSGNPGSWIGLGFAQNVATNAAVGYGRLSDGGNTPPQQGPNGYDWLLLQYSGNVQYFSGPGGGGVTLTNATLFTANTPATHAVTVVLDTTGTQWVQYAFVDGVSAGTNTFASNPAIGAVGITQTSLGSPGYIQWNSFALTQMAPNGVPPYLFAPLPPVGVTLKADSSLSISVSAFGTTPVGYYWSNTNNATVLTSGATNTTAPLIANLNIADVPSSWNGNTLALIVTNAYGTNISLVALTVTNPIIIPLNKPTITGFSFVGGTNLMVSATNGQSGGTYYLLGSTNLTSPFAQWLPLATNVIVTNGNAANGFTFTGTNVINISNPQQFFILSNTN